MTPSQACISLVKKYEGCRLDAYRDIKGILTIGYGRTDGVKEGDACTQEQAEEWLLDGLQRACDCVLDGLDCGLSQGELDALTSLTYNIGCANFKHSTLRLYLSRGQYDKAAGEFEKWCHAGKVVVQGLLNRRMAEREMFTG